MNAFPPFKPASWEHPSPPERQGWTGQWLCAKIRTLRGARLTNGIIGFSRGNQLQGHGNDCEDGELHSGLLMDLGAAMFMVRWLKILSSYIRRAVSSRLEYRGYWGKLLV